MLVQEVGGILEKGGFDYCFYSGCFDIAAQKDFTFFLKVLGNVDSFQEKQATNLKIVARDFNAAVALVGLHTRRETLKDNVVYDRFDIPTLTPETLEGIIINETFPFLYRTRGGMFAEINPEKLRTLRQEAGLSQSDLAEKVGITKKAVYEHERSRKKSMLEVANKIEKVIGDVKEPLVLNFDYPEASNRPRERFERQVFFDLKRIGFSADLVYQTPFNIAARSENILLMSKAGENKKSMERDVQHVSSISELTEIPAMAVTKGDIDLSIPTVSEKDLRNMSKKDLRKMLK